MGYSFYEIYTTSQRAFKGMGFPFGADEDAAYIIAWLELNNLNGINIFKDIVDQIDQQYDGVLNIKDTDKKIDLKNKSILMKGPSLIDFLESNIDQDQEISININNCSNGILFLPLLYKANKNIKFLELIYKYSDFKSNNFRFHDGKIFHNVEESTTNDREVKINLSNKQLNIIDGVHKEIINEKTIQENLSKSLIPKENDWHKISIIASRTFVPESEESRKKGAGGGDANE